MERKQGVNVITGEWSVKIEKDGQLKQGRDGIVVREQHGSKTRTERHREKYEKETGT